MLPVVAGTSVTKKWILAYSILLLPTSLLPCIFGSAGDAYGVTAAILGTTMIVFAARLLTNESDDRALAYRLFAFSIIYLFMLFSMLMVDALSSSGSFLARLIL